MDVKHADSFFKLDRGEGNMILARFETLAEVLVVLTYNVINFQPPSNSDRVSVFPRFRY